MFFGIRFAEHGKFVKLGKMGRGCEGGRASGPAIELEMEFSPREEFVHSQSRTMAAVSQIYTCNFQWTNQKGSVVVDSRVAG